MGFYSGYSTPNSAGAVLAGLGKLTSPGSNSPNKDARRVVGAFVRGEVARGACSKKSGCEIVATGSELKVGDLVLARRPVSTASHISVCVPDRGEMVKLKSGKTVEARRSKDVRAAAGALLRAVGTGLGVRTDKDGIRRLVGAHGKRAAEVPGSCIVVKLNKHQTAVAASGMQASQEAMSTYTKAFPTKREIARIRDIQLKAKRSHALVGARAKALSARVDAAAKAQRKRFAKSGKRGWVAESKGWVAQNKRKRAKADKAYEATMKALEAEGVRLRAKSKRKSKK